MGLSSVVVSWSSVISVVWYPDPEGPRDKAAWLWGPVCHMVSQLGGEATAQAQVTCFCVARWAVSGPSLNQQAASLTGGFRTAKAEALLHILKPAPMLL